MSSMNTVTGAGPGDGDHQVQPGKCGSAGIQKQNVGDQQVVFGDEDEGVGRSDFPPNFVFGVATAAYQVEGACKEGGRGACIWDAFTHTDGKIRDGSNGDIAVDQYHRYKEDIDLISKLGFAAYRFSISWSRIFPDGFGTKINDEGVAYYNNVINALLEKGLLPYVTLYHWDLPQNLHESMGGWLNRELFTIYAETCFSNFGDRVKNWITINEPLQTAVNGYCTGIFAPGRNEHPSTEPYIAAHHQILAHAASVSIYKKKYKDTQRGQIGFVVDCEWAEPFSDQTEDINAALRRIEFQLGWFLDPLLYGDYPEIMREKIGDKLPKFSQEDKELLHNAIDFIGLNHYTSRYIAHGANDFEQNEYYKAQEIISIVELEGGKLIGERAASSWLYVVPWGIRKLLNYIKLKYKEVPIYVTENGMDDGDDDTLPLNEILDDKKRVGYYKGYLSGVAQAIKDGADVRGYFAWSLLDNFEWAEGYTKRFGLVYVDYKDGLSRHPKSSARWFSRFLRGSGAKRSVLTA